MNKSIRKTARESGYDASHISKVMSGKRMPSLPAAATMAKTMGLTLDEFWSLVRMARRKAGKPIDNRRVQMQASAAAKKVRNRKPKKVGPEFYNVEGTLY